MTRTVPELVEHLRKLVESRGGLWPAEVSSIVEVVLYDFALHGIPVRARVLELLQQGPWQGTQEEMSEMLGTTREHLARTLHRMMEEGTVRREGQYRGVYELVA